MDDLKDALAYAGAVVDERTVTEDVLGDLALHDVISELQRLATESLRTLAVTKDSEANEDALHDLLLTTSMKALLAGLQLGQSSQVPDPGIVVPVSEEVMTEIGLAAIRGGGVSFTLFAGAFASEANGNGEHDQ